VDRSQTSKAPALVPSRSAACAAPRRPERIHVCMSAERSCASAASASSSDASACWARSPRRRMRSLGDHEARRSCVGTLLDTRTSRSRPAAQLHQTTGHQRGADSTRGDSYRAGHEVLAGHDRHRHKDPLVHAFQALEARRHVSRSRAAAEFGRVASLSGKQPHLPSRPD
jgi:hypothetical protein